MVKTVRERLSYANVMATVAVFMALSGGAYAAATLPRSSVGTRQLKADAVTSSRVKDRSLLARDFRAGQLPAGPRGLQGAAGNTGPTGPAGPAGTNGTDGTNGANGTNGATNVTFRSATVAVSSGPSTAQDAVLCPTGQRATGGGYNTGGDTAFAIKSGPTVDALGNLPAQGATPLGWAVRIRNPLGGVATTGNVYVVCAAP